MYSGMADVAALTGDTGYIKAIGKIWENVVSKKLYITGGIGATNHGEAFGKNYELPTCPPIARLVQQLETCIGIIVCSCSMVMQNTMTCWNERYTTD
jgi:DUF1680 family protein